MSSLLGLNRVYPGVYIGFVQGFDGDCVSFSSGYLESSRGLFRVLPMGLIGIMFGLIGVI